MTRKIRVNDFAIALTALDDIKQSSVGLIKAISGERVKVFFIGKAVIRKTGRDDIKFLDVEKTGKPYPKKICNVCHILKIDKSAFDKNQTDAKGRKTTRPSCKACRKIINGVKLEGAEKQKLDAVKPQRCEIFICPICEKTSIAGITAKLVRDHDHKTGRAREWICDSCNTGLGRFKDDIKLIERIRDYLTKHAR